MNAEELAVMMMLRGQVKAALWTMHQSGHPGADEWDVETVITRPLENLFRRAVGIPDYHTLAVWGSETKVVESDEYWSWSRPKLPC